MIKNIFLFGLLLLLLAKIIYPQQDVKFESLSLQEGVAHNLTFSIIKDSKGFLWFGTMYGLARYEGSGYTIFNHDPEDPASISFDDIISLYEDRNGNIWIGTWGGGLNKYDPFKGKFTRFLYQKNNPEGINDNVVWAIAEDNEGNIWLGTERGGLNKYNPSSDKFTHYKHNPSDPKSIGSNSIKSLLYDSKGNLWIGSTTGLSKSDGNGSFINFKNYPDDLNSISGGVVKVIFEDSKKNIWVGTSSGLNKFDGKFTFTRFISDQALNSLSSNFVTGITEDDAGSLWVGTNNGLNCFEPETRVFTKYFHNPEDPFSLSGNSVHSLLLDDSGLLWVSIYNKGINKSIRSAQSNFINLKNYPDKGALSNKNVLSFAEGKDYRVWIGTRYGLNYYDPRQDTIINIPPDSNPRKNSIGALATDLDGNLWIGTQAGLNLFNPVSQTFYEPELNGLREAGLLSTHITTILIDSLTVWIGTYNNGLFRLDRNSNSLSRFSFDGKYFDNYQADFLLSLYKDKLGRIWAGTYGGLMMYDNKVNSFVSYTNNPDDRTSLSNNYIFSIFEDSRKELWIGTANGLNRYNHDDSTFEHFFEKDGLPNSVICSITEDFNRELWISTNKGISKFNYKERLFTNYSIPDGLNGNLFNPGAGLYALDTMIVFGGSWGGVLFYPGDMKFSSYNPPVYISSIKKINTDGKSVLLTSFKDEVEISSSEKTIIFKFASLDYSNPSNNKFFYMLEGIDSEYKNLGYRNDAAYTNLEPGEYLLKVKGTNSDGVFSDNTVEMKILIVPPFWQTWWFKLLALIIVILFVFYLLRYKVRSKIKKEIELQKIREELAARIRKQTAIDFHDELGHRLTRISLLAGMIRKKLHNTFTEVDILLKNISENSYSLYEGTRDFIWAIDPEQDNLFDLIIRLKDFGDELFNGTDINFSIKGLDESLQKVPVNIEWKRHVTLIFKEAMHNTLRYSECENAVLEVLLGKKNEVKIYLFDDGKGFDSDKLYNGNGLKNMKQRGEKIGGVTDIDSRLNIGTKILFKGIIPLNYLDYNRKVA